MYHKQVKTGLIYSAVEGLNAAIYLERNKTTEVSGFLLFFLMEIFIYLFKRNLIKEVTINCELFSEQQTRNLKMDDNSSKGLSQAFNREQKLCGLFTPLQTNYVLKEPPVLLGRSASVISISQVVVLSCCTLNICVPESSILHVIVIVIKAQLLELE